MQPYPAITQSDPMQQMLGQVMGGYKPNQLGAGVTLGNPEAQQDYIAELARALADGEFSAKQIEQAGSMLTPEFIQNSGIAGVADMMLKTYVGKKMDERGRKLQADAETRRMAAQEGVDDRRAMKEAERAEALTTRERTRREVVARQMGLNNREKAEFIETGKVPQAVRGVPMMTNQGLVNVNPYTNEYEQVQPQGQQRSQPQTPFQIEGDVPPEVRAAMQADPAAWESGKQIDIPPPQQPLMPYVDPAVAQQREASNRRADEAAARADRADDRAERAFKFQQEQAAKKNGTGGNALDMWEEARAGLESALGNTETGYFAGRMPTLTAAQQTAEGAVAATAPILKQIFRTAGEGTFTDKDQELLLRMVPTRTDEPEARASKLENIDRIIRAKLGVKKPEASASDEAPAQRIRIKL